MPLLSLPAEEASRRIAIGLVREALEASERLRIRADADALHDLRVALRRLRSVVRALKEPLDGSLTRRDRKQLRDLAGGTGDARDAEVQLGWAQKLLDGALEPEERVAVMYLRDRWAARAESALSKIDRSVLPDLASFLPRLERRLSTYQIEHRVFSSDTRSGSLGPLVVRLAEAEVGALAERLRRVATVEDEAIAHEARIHAKRLRYLLEPFRSDRADVEATVQTLRGLQELLGDLNDRAVRTAEITRALEALATSHVRGLVREALDEWADAAESMKAEAVQPGLLAVLRHEGARKLATFEKLVSEWTRGPGLETLEREVTALGSGMQPPSPPLEIERKYLLKSLPPRTKEAPSSKLEQGYLPGEKLIERVRRVRTQTGEHHYRTVKLGSGVSRIEIEEECSAQLFAKLWPLTKGKRVQKTRYVVPDGALVWEIDAFIGRKLFLAEIELPSADTEVVFPDWLAPHVERDVTDEPEYVNARLAR